MKKKAKIILWVAVSVLICAYGAYEALKPLEVETYTANTQTVMQEFMEEGIVTSQEIMYIYPGLAGKITELNFEEGQMVDEGYVVARQDTTQLMLIYETAYAAYVNAVELRAKTYSEAEEMISQAELSGSSAFKQYNYAKNEYSRVKSLYDVGSSTKVALDAALQGVNQANIVYQQAKIQTEELKSQYSSDNSETSNYLSSSVEAAAAPIAEIKNQIEMADIKAGMKGVLSKKSIEKGDYVMPQTSIGMIHDPEKLMIITHVLADDVASVNENMKVLLTRKLRGGDVEFTGTINKIYPYAEEVISSLGLIEQKVKVEIIPEISDGMVFKYGYSVDVTFQTNIQKDVIAVPNLSMFSQAEGYAVWKIENGKLKLQRVEKGMETSTDTVITKGLSTGDIIVKDANQKELVEGKSSKSLNE